MNPNESIPEELLSAYLDGELDAIERQAVERALEQDAEMRALLADLELIRTELQQLPSHSLGSDFAKKVITAAENADQASPERIASGQQSRQFMQGRLFVGLIATAASILIAIVTIPPLMNRNSTVNVVRLPQAEFDDAIDVQEDTDSQPATADSPLASDSSKGAAEVATEAANTLSNAAIEPADSLPESLDTSQAIEERNANLKRSSGADLARQPNEATTLNRVANDMALDNEAIVALETDANAADDQLPIDVLSTANSLSALSSEELQRAAAPHPKTSYDAVLYFAAMPRLAETLTLKKVASDTLRQEMSLDEDREQIELVQSQSLEKREDRDLARSPSVSSSPPNRQLPNGASIPPDAELYVLQGTVEQVRATLRAMQSPPTKMLPLSSNASIASLGLPTPASLTQLPRRSMATPTATRSRAANTVAPSFASSPPSKQATRSFTAPTDPAQPAPKVSDQESATQSGNLRLLLVVPKDQ